MVRPRARACRCLHTCVVRIRARARVLFAHTHVWFAYARAYVVCLHACVVRGRARPCRVFTHVWFASARARVSFAYTHVWFAYARACRLPSRMCGSRARACVCRLPIRRCGLRLCMRVLFAYAYGVRVLFARKYVVRVYVCVNLFAYAYVSLAYAYVRVRICRSLVCVSFLKQCNRAFQFETCSQSFLHSNHELLLCFFFFNMRHVVSSSFLPAHPSLTIFLATCLLSRFEMHSRQYSQASHQSTLQVYE